MRIEKLSDVHNIDRLDHDVLISVVHSEFLYVLRGVSALTYHNEPHALDKTFKMYINRCGYKLESFTMTISKRLAMQFSDRSTSY